MNLLIPSSNPIPLLFQIFQVCIEWGVTWPPRQWSSPAMFPPSLYFDVFDGSSDIQVFCHLVPHMQGPYMAPNILHITHMPLSSIQGRHHSAVFMGQSMTWNMDLLMELLTQGHTRDTWTIEKLLQNLCRSFSLLYQGELYPSNAVYLIIKGCTARLRWKS